MGVSASFEFVVYVAWVVCVHIFWGRAEVDVWCLPLLLSTLIFETVSPTEPGAHQLTGLACQ